MNAKLLGRLAICTLYLFALPIYAVQWVLGASKAMKRMSVLRTGIIACPHCGFTNHIDALMSCRRCGTTEFGSRLYCTACKQVSKAFACDRCTATIKVL
jgi:ribosomal protein S27AE